MVGFTSALAYFSESNLSPRRRTLMDLLQQLYASEILQFSRSSTEEGSVRSQTMMMPSSLLFYAGAMNLNLSCPAVSQICNLMFLPCWLAVLNLSQRKVFLKSTDSSQIIISELVLGQQHGKGKTCLLLICLSKSTSPISLYILVPEENNKSPTQQSQPPLPALQLQDLFSFMQPVNNQKSVGKRLWSKDEDDSLRKIVEETGDCLQWATISQKFNERMQELGRAVKRTNKQCRERWQNHLNPLLSNNAEWSPDEHHMLFTLLRHHSQQWCQISAKLREAGFRCRSDNHIKNYFYSSIKKAIKRINQLLKHRNRIIKKQKSIMLNYNQKYAYQRHLSLQRQLQNAPLNPNPYPSPNPNPIHTPSVPSPELKIIKELDQEIVRKILLIAESKGAKKFTISYKKYQQDAINTRNKLIDFIQNDRQFSPQDIISLVAQILDLSKKCKRKNRKNQSMDESVSYQDDSRQENSLLCSPNQTEKHNYDQKDQSSFLQKMCEEQISTRQNRCKPIKFYDQGANHNQNDQICNTYDPPKTMLLDRSNPYLFASEDGFVRHIISKENQMMGNQIQQTHNLNLFEQSQNLMELNQSYEPLDFYKTENIVKLRGGSAEFEFLSTIKQLNPSKILDHEQLFDLDINEVMGTNPFTNVANLNSQFSSEKDKCLEAHFRIFDKNQTIREDNNLSDQSDTTTKHIYLNRSWAYSSSLLKDFRTINQSNFDIALRSRASAPL